MRWLLLQLKLVIFLDMSDYNQLWLQSITGCTLGMYNWESCGCNSNNTNLTVLYQINTNQQLSIVKFFYCNATQVTSIMQQLYALADQVTNLKNNNVEQNLSKQNLTDLYAKINALNAQYQALVTLIGSLKNTSCPPGLNPTTCVAQLKPYVTLYNSLAANLSAMETQIWGFNKNGNKNELAVFVNRTIALRLQMQFLNSVIMTTTNCNDLTTISLNISSLIEISNQIQIDFTNWSYQNNPTPAPATTAAPTTKTTIPLTTTTPCKPVCDAAANLIPCFDNCTCVTIANYSKCESILVNLNQTIAEINALNTIDANKQKLITAA